MTNIKRSIEGQRIFFQTGASRNVDYRIKALKKLESLIVENEIRILDALRTDLKKPDFESILSEVEFVLMELRHAIKNIKKWTRPQKVKTPLMHFPASSYIHPEPYGVTLIISPWNYPFQLAIAPLIGSITAGNCAIVKPSELAPATAELLEELINNHFEPGHLKVMQGGVEETQQILNHRFDYIFYTGSTAVGKIIMKAAAEFLCPVTLELGGKSPAIIDNTANLKVTAQRVVWGKFMNAGQTCIAPDYLFVNKEIKSALMEELKKTIKEFYGSNPQKSSDYARIINKRHFDRLQTLLKNEQIVCGGEADPQDLFITPTIIESNDFSSPVMQEEIFGPILPVLEFENANEMIEQINKGAKPLALYVFSKNKKFIKKVINETSSGGVCVNEPLSHITSASLPFGGVGDSGMGQYHGKFSFDTFSHMKSVMHKSFQPDPKVKYAPYRKLSPLMRRILKIIS